MTEIDGAIILRGKMMELPVAVRMTIDRLGASLSLADDRTGLMLEVPMEQLKDWMRDWVQGEWK